MPLLSLEQFGFRALRLTPPKPMNRIHHHQELELNYVFSGAITYLHGGVVRQLGPGRLAVFWGAVPHSIVGVADGSDMAWITVPLALVRQWGVDPPFIGRLLQGGWIMAPPHFEGRFPVSFWVEEMASGASCHRSLSHELRGCLCWIANRDKSTAGAPDHPSHGLLPLEKMACHMAEHFQEPIGVSDIAKAANLHPKYAMALFKRHCGLTIRDYLTRLRLMHAQRALLESGEKITHVAFDCGFASLSAFYESFTRWIGVTPTRYRRQFREGSSRPTSFT